VCEVGLKNPKATAATRTIDGTFNKMPLSFWRSVVTNDCESVLRVSNCLRIEISFGFAAPPAATTEAPPWPLSRRGRDPGTRLTTGTGTLPLCLHRKASPFWIMVLLVLVCAISGDSTLILRTRRRAQITFPLLAQSGHAEERNRCCYWGQSGHGLLQCKCPLYDP